MSRWTFATASNAASTAHSVSPRAAPVLAISTKVPKSGRARRTLSHISISGQNSLHAFGDVDGRQRRTGDVADIVAHFQRTAAGLADELRKPAWAAHFAAIGFSVGQNIDALHAAAHDRHRIVDIEMLADDMVGDKYPAGARFPDAAGLDRGKARGRKRRFLRLGDRHVVDRISRRADRYQRRHRRGPAYPFRHLHHRSDDPPPRRRTPCFELQRNSRQKKKPTAPRNESELAPAGSLLTTF